RSITTNLMPVGTPINAFGFSVHQRCTVSASQDASLKPAAVSGRLSGAQGNIGTPRRASFNASAERFLLDIKIPLAFSSRTKIPRGCPDLESFSCEPPRFAGRFAISTHGSWRASRQRARREAARSTEL